MKPSDWTLLVLAAAQGKELQPVHVQKTLFLLGENLSRKQLKVRTFYDFSPYDYGPFCANVYVDAEELEREGLAEIDQPACRSYRSYRATDEGMNYAKQLREELEPSVVDYLDRLVSQIRRLSFRALVSAIYKAYPKMRANSVFQE
jgi:uncharacterized protein